MNGVVTDIRKIMKLPYTENITAIQLIYYIKKTWKTVHFDGRRLTDGVELYGFTFEAGKKICVGTTMVMGQATNRRNIVKIPKNSVYIMGPVMQTEEWHGICRLANNRTMMGRYAINTFG